MWLATVALSAAALQAPAAAPPDGGETKGKTHLLVAEAVRVDLRRHVLFVKTADTPPVELPIGVEAGKTRVSSGGKAIRIEDVRPGDRVAVSCSDDAAGAHTARLIVIRPRGAASPAPSATPKPGAPD